MCFQQISERLHIFRRTLLELHGICTDYHPQLMTPMTSFQYPAMSLDRIVTTIKASFERNPGIRVQEEVRLSACML